MKYLYRLFILFNFEFISSLIDVDLTHTIRSTNPVFPGLVSFNFTRTIKDLDEKLINRRTQMEIREMNSVFQV